MVESYNLMSSRMKKNLLIILYNIAVIIVLFLLLECVVRIFVPAINLSGTSSNLVVDSLYNDSPGIRSDITGISGGVEKASDGYHAWKYTKPVSAESRKLLFLGDSVTMGISVENDSTYAGIVNDNFDSLNIINPSLIGYSSKDYVNVFDGFILQNRFKLNFSSVVVFWTLNDIYSNYPDRKSPEFNSQGFLNSIVNFFRHNSKAYHFLKNIFSDRPRAYFEYDRQFYKASNPLLLNSLKNIETISSACDSLGIHFEVVLLPYEYQLRKTDNKDIFEPQMLIRKKLKEKNISFVDLRNAFVNDKKEPSSYYLYGDGIHFNKSGNRLIAGYLKKHLQLK